MESESGNVPTWQVVVSEFFLKNGPKMWVRVYHAELKQFPKAIKDLKKLDKQN